MSEDTTRCYTFFMQLQSREMQRPAFSSNFPHHMFVRLSLWPDDKNHYSNNVEFLGCVCDWHVFFGSSYPPKKAKKKAFVRWKAERLTRWF